MNRSVVLGILLACCAGCRSAQSRAITTPVIDPSTGTVYAFEVHDVAGRGSDETLAIICNEELSGVCYRVRPGDALDGDDLRALQNALRELRVRRAEAEIRRELSERGEREERERREREEREDRARLERAERALESSGSNP